MEIKKALTFRASSIGDCLMGAYLLNNVHAEFPQAKLAIVVGSKGAMIRDLLGDYPWIEVVEANRRSISALWRLWRTYRGSDVVVTQYAGKMGGAFSMPSKVMARILARKGGLVGFSDASRFNGFLYDRIVPFEGRAAPAQMEREALRLAGVTVGIPYPLLTHTSTTEPLLRFGLQAGAYVLVHLFSGSKKRALSPEKNHLLVEVLAQQLPSEVEIVLSGTAQERGAAQMFAEGTRAKVIAQKTTLQEMLTLIQESKSVVAVDTGVAHMTAQLKHPLRVITSCLGAHWWQPEQYGPNPPIEVFTNKNACGGAHQLIDYPPCMNDIDMAQFVQNLL
jgi:ADP-heptose:LPS heptosyltransferase